MGRPKKAHPKRKGSVSTRAQAHFGATRLGAAGIERESVTVADVLSGARRFHVSTGDCLALLRTLPDSSIDAVVTDPPAGISFMGAAWDGDKGGRAQWTAWLSSVMAECLRVLRPGGHALVWALPRTSHWTGAAIEDAGFEVRDVVTHLFGSGFPKSLNIGDGRGTALKPAAEFWFLARKPFRGGVAANVLTHGTGALNVDACRVAAHEALVRPAVRRVDNVALGAGLGSGTQVEPAGRWPAHLVLSHAPRCELVGTRKVKAARDWYETDRRASLFTGETTSTVGYADADGTETVDDWRCVDGCPCKAIDEQSGASISSDQTRHNSAFKSVAKGHESARTTHGFSDEGGASRYFNTFGPAPFLYEPKSPTAEKERGLEHRKAKSGAELTGRKPGSAGLDNPRSGSQREARLNTHPTPKSIALMRWLCRLVTPPGGLVLDPFTGSGSTGVACSQEGLRFLGFELSSEFASIARDRIIGDSPLLNREVAR